MSRPISFEATYRQILEGHMARKTAQREAEIRRETEKQEIIERRGRPKSEACGNGHAWTDWNTGYSTHGRYCRTCARKRTNECLARKRKAGKRA